MKRNWQTRLEPIMRHAGEILLSYWGKPLTRQQKADNGFVTEADLASEKYLVEALQRLLPTADFYTEERGKFGSNNSGYQWVIDPLDGTTNFAHGVPYFCISVALAYENKPICGAIYVPLQDEFFFAQEGKGAFLNGKAINVSAPNSLSEALVAVGLPYRVKKRSNALEDVENIAQHVQSIRHYGAVALDLANVAVGRFDGLYFTGLAWWDVAAGVLLVQEAGGLATDSQGLEIGPDYESCMAGGGLVYEGLGKILDKNTVKIE